MIKPLVIISYTLFLALSAGAKSFYLHGYSFLHYNVYMPDNAFITISNDTKTVKNAIDTEPSTSFAQIGFATDQQGLLAVNQQSIVFPLLAKNMLTADTSRAKILVDAAESLMMKFDRQRADSAISLLTKAILLNPTNKRALKNLAEIHIQRTDEFELSSAYYDTAAIFAHRLVDFDPATGWRLLGQIYRLKSEFNYALEAFENSIKSDPSSEDALYYYGYTFFDLGRHDMGIPVLIGIAKANPQFRAVRNMLGFSFLHIGRPELARQPFEESDVLRMTSYSVGGKMMIHLADGNYEQAIKYTDSVSKVVTDHAWPLARLGEALLFSGRFAEAEAVLEEAVRRDSTVVSIYTWKAAALQLAYLYARRGRLEEAQPLINIAYMHADKMIRRGQEPWNAYYQYAALSLMQRDRDGAIRWLRTAHSAGMPGPVLIETDALFSALHDDIEFLEIVHRLRWRQNEILERLVINE